MTDPFFICFVSRSGSTFLANLLTKRNDVSVLPESNFVTRLIQQYGVGDKVGSSDPDQLYDFLFAENKFRDLNVTREHLVGMIEEDGVANTADLVGLICKLAVDPKAGSPRQMSASTIQACSSPNTRRIGFKKGNYIRSHQSISKLFPGVQFVILHRDGRAVFNSQRSSTYSQTGKPFETDAARSAREWRSFVRLARQVEKLYGDAVYTLSYESLIKEGEETVAALERFLNLRRRPTGQQAASYEVAERYGELHRNIDRGPLHERASAWADELSEDQIRAFERVAGKELISCGYSLRYETRRGWI